MSKGSSPRPIADRQSFVERWDAIFKEKCPECQSPDWHVKHGSSACGMEAYANVCNECGHEWNIG